MKKGIKFLEKWAVNASGQSFFLTLSSAPPHFPHHLPEEYVKLAQKLRIRVELPANMKDTTAEDALGSTQRPGGVV